MFENIIGQEKAKDVIMKALIVKSLPNTLLFHGPDGVGKGLFAKELAKELVLLSSKKDEGRIDHGSHPDFHEYLLESDNKMHPIQSMRDMIDEIYKPPYEGSAKVFVIHDAEKMLESSSNAILKTLEEPSLDSYVILLSSKPSELLPTIYSRCFKVRFSAVELHKIISYLESVCNKSQGFAEYIAKMSMGSIGRAHLLASDSNIKTTIEKLIDILKNQCVPAFEEIDKICKDIDSNNILLEIIFSTLLMWFRDQAVSLFDANLSHLFFKDDLAEKPLGCSLENIHYFLEKARKGIDRNIKLSSCLHNFFIDVYGG